MGIKPVDRRAFFRRIGGVAAAATMGATALADELENQMLEQLAGEVNCEPPPPEGSDGVRRGAGIIFNRERTPELSPMPERPTLIDFFERRFDDGIVQHCLRSAHHALTSGQDEIHVMAALVHDTIMTLMRTDHGYWGADFLAPYVDEKIAWGIRYHQALRFYPDESVGYEYPDLYKQMFGENFVPEPYIQDAYASARKHRWYMHARMITVNDTYGFDASINPSLDDFVDIVGRNFRQPKEGLGYDDSPSAHMWRSLLNPDRPL